jgi:hypothetical protein
MGAYGGLKAVAAGRRRLYPDGKRVLKNTGRMRWER